MKKEFSKQYYVEANGVANFTIANISIEGYTPIAITEISTGEGHIALSVIDFYNDYTNLNVLVRNLWHDPLTRTCKVIILYAKNIA